MLTGVLPFPGKTTAQLMSQHLYSKPRSRALPLGERAAIARALAKEPGERFPNCREMIAALLAAGRGLQAAVPSEAPTEVRQRVDTDSAGSGSAGTATEMELAPSGHSSWGGDDPPTLHTLAWDDVALAAGKSAPRPRPSIPSEPQAGPAVVVALPPIEAATKEPRLRPTLFLGIGGTAARVLSRLHRKICDRAGSLASLPAVEMVLWDTDLDALSEAASGRGAGSLEVRQTLALPLRRPQEYRENSEKLLRWLSRRWLYNIPRSLRTEGIRPLGRLAMVDHSQEVLARLDVALRSIASPDALTTSAGALGMESAEASPQVFLVASISGGTGSGMVLDAAYAVRQVLRGLGLPDDAVYGILLHSTVHDPSARDLAIANACACLQELRHYARSGSFPGDPAMGLLATQSDSGPFAQSYLVHLGDALNESQFDQAAASLAEYLYLDVFSAAGAIFDACRRDAPGNASPGREWSLRTVGLTHADCSPSGMPGEATELLCKVLAERWCDGGSSQRSCCDAQRTGHPPRERIRQAEGDEDGSCSSAGPSSAVKTPPLRIDGLEKWVQRVEDMIERDLGGAAEAVLRAMIEGLGQRRSGQPGEGVTPAEILGAIQSLAGGPERPASRSEIPQCRLHSAIDPQLREQTDRIGTDLSRSVLALVETSPTRIAGAHEAAQLAVEQFRDLEAEAEAAIGEVAANLPAMEKDIRGGGPSPWSGWLGRARHSVTPNDAWSAYLRRGCDSSPSARSLRRYARCGAILARGGPAG